jgi:hypothetical protein
LRRKPGARGEAMIDVAIPGFGRLALEHLVCDYNGTLARDGVLLDGVAARLTALACGFNRSTQQIG